MRPQLAPGWGCPSGRSGGHPLRCGTRKRLIANATLWLLFVTLASKKRPGGGRLDHTVGEPRGVAVKHAGQSHMAGRRLSLRQPARTWWGSALSFRHRVGFRTTSPTNPAPAAATPRDTIPRSTPVAAGSASLERARPRAGPWEQARPGLERGKAGSLGLSDRNAT